VHELIRRVTWIRTERNLHRECAVECHVTDIERLEMPVELGAERSRSTAIPLDRFDPRRYDPVP